MPEWILVDDGPNGCMFCGDIEGPFVGSNSNGAVIQTAAGPTPQVAPNRICAPNERRMGCAGAIALAVGYLTPDQAENLRSQLSGALGRVSELEHELADAEGNKVVKVDELLDMLERRQEEKAGGAPV